MQTVDAVFVAYAVALRVEEWLGVATGVVVLAALLALLGRRTVAASRLLSPRLR